MDHGEAESPLDMVLLHFPEVRHGTIIGRMGRRDDICWYIRMPDASYCMVQIWFNEKPAKKLRLFPELADFLEEVWQEMGTDALGEEEAGWKWASREFSSIAELTIVDAGCLP